MRIEAARAVARRWVHAHADAPVPLVGAFFSGSTVEAAPDDVLAPDSDVDVCLVVDGPAPAKPGKLDVEGVRVEATYVSWSDLADPDVVARTPVLAPSFARDTVVLDPDGRLGRLRDHVRSVFARPDVVTDRYRAVLDRIRAATPPPEPTPLPEPVEGPEPTPLPEPVEGPDAWAQQVTAWLFPTSLSTHVVLVAACRNPTVRLRYVRAREVLEAHGLAAAYPPLLASLGCADVRPDVVRRHLATLTRAFDAAAAAGPTTFFFASDITPDARPIAVDGAAALVARGDHREAVFWLLATFARCVQILNATRHPEQDAHADAFAAAARDLVGVTTPDDLRVRHGELLAALPDLEQLARTILERGDDRGHPGVRPGR